MKSIVSLELSSGALHAAEIHMPLSKRPKIVKVASIPLPDGMAGESSLYAAKQFAELITKAWKKHRFSTKDVALTVGGKSFVVRPHETRHTDMKMLQENIRYEAASVIPENMNDPMIAFYPTERSKRDETVTRGLVIAAATDPISRIAGALADAGLRIEYVDYAPMAIARFIRRDVQPDGSYLVVNVREDTTDVVFGREGVPLFVRTIPRGLPAMMKEEKTEEEEHEERIGLSPMDALARDVKLTVSSLGESVRIDTLYIAGNGSLEKPLAKALSEAVEAPTEALIPRLIELVKGKPKLNLRTLSSSFVAICGGMRGEKKVK